MMVLTAVVALVAQYVQPATRVAVLTALAIAYLAVGVTIDLRWRTRKEART